MQPQKRPGAVLQLPEILFLWGSANPDETLLTASQSYSHGRSWLEVSDFQVKEFQASINTDDKGVFYTSLENEFALMARATELVMDDEGKPVYKKLIFMIG